MQQLTNDFTGAVATLSQAAQTAMPLGLHDLAFEAWNGVARAYEYGAPDHRAAVVAFGRAVDEAGGQPSVKERADLAD